MTSVTKKRIIVERDKKDERKAHRCSQSYIEHFSPNLTKSQPKKRFCSRMSFCCALSFSSFVFVLLFMAVWVAAAVPNNLESKVLQGQEMIFARRYDDAKKMFETLKRDYPNSPAASFGLMALYEMQMLEREDFHLENEFLAEAKAGNEKVAKILAMQRPDKWDLFLSGSLLGIEGFFRARKGDWWAAYTSGTKSRQIFKHVKAIDPLFADADFGLGMYIYWRSVFASDLWFLKMLPDRRAEGMAIVERVAREGSLAKELARVNLGVMYFEEKRFREAEKIFEEYVSRFPGNVILRNFLGRVELASEKFDLGIAQFREILKIDPALLKPHYFIGAALVLKNDPTKFSEAESELKEFLSKQGGKYWPSYAHYWLGRLAEARGDKDMAAKEYGEALKLNSKIQDAARRARSMGGGI